MYLIDVDRCLRIAYIPHIYKAAIAYNTLQFTGLRGQGWTAREAEDGELDPPRKVQTHARV